MESNVHEKEVCLYSDSQGKCLIFDKQPDRTRVNRTIEPRGVIDRSSSSLIPKASRRLIGTQSGHFGMDADSNAASELSPMPKPCSAHQEMTNNHCYDFRLPARMGQT
ncbi:hypothetical protein DPX16_15546 [Anabarilius grahami]|uniref:Uncharacterized protein n=1 Tax=Anabarilius grahami TaxID=495550 RepID=A0A3N0YIM3_ANAGA|nr:hypothetical protein DPX16_15546 [Anabarilius grahami]